MSLSKRKQTHRHRELVVMGGGNLGVGGGRYKLLGVRQAQGCIVQHGEYSQYFVKTVSGKEPLNIVQVFLTF